MRAGYSVRVIRAQSQREVASLALRRCAASGLPCALRFSASHDLIHSGPSTSVAVTTTPVVLSRRAFFSGVFGPKAPQVRVDEVIYDKENAHYNGTILGLSADGVVFYSKIASGACVAFVVIYIFFKGYSILANVSLQTVARLGFTGGFVCCLIFYSIALALTRRVRINANAVYNQSISLVMQNEKVQRHLGTHPRTGEFKAYAASGGFKLPLLRRIRSGSYELSDLLGLKQRRLQMMFLLKNPVSGHEGLVTCDVRKEPAGFLTSSYVFKSLSITLSNKERTKEPETVIVIGKPEDSVYRGLMRL